MSEPWRHYAQWEDKYCVRSQEASDTQTGSCWWEQELRNECLMGMSFSSRRWESSGGGWWQWLPHIMPLRCALKKWLKRLISHYAYLATIKRNNKSDNNGSQPNASIVLGDLTLLLTTARTKLSLFCKWENRGVSNLLKVKHQGCGGWCPDLNPGCLPPESKLLMPTL